MTQAGLDAPSGCAGRRLATRWQPAVLGIALSAMSALTGCSPQDPEPTRPQRPVADKAPSPSPDNSGPPGSANVATPAPSQVDAQQPLSIELPSGTTVAVDATVTGDDGALHLPSDVRRAGWWDGSSRLGDPYGSIVLAAHVDSFTQGLGRFAELLDADRGDVVDVETRDLAQQYRITSAKLVPKTAITERSGVFSVAGDPRLVLITCGGPYDPQLGGYQDNLVVIAQPVGDLETR